VQVLNVYVGPAGSVPPNLSGVTSFTFFAGKNGKDQFAATGNPSPAISIVGALPPGLTSKTSRGKLQIIGKALASGAGIYALTVTAGNVAGTTSQSILLTVASTPTITSSNKVTFTDGAANQFQVAATGGYPGSTSLAIAGALPPGVTFVDEGGGVGVLSGSPSGTGHTSYTLKVQASNGAGTTSQTFHLKTVP
jgi:hypothetical protein